MSMQAQQHTTSVRLLNLALATELLGRQRYTTHSAAAARGHDHEVAADFLQHAAEKQQHAEQLARRIVELGGRPDLDPLPRDSRDAAPLVEAYELPELVRDNVVAECVVIDTYAEMIGCLQDADVPTRNLLEELLVLGEAQGIRLIRLMRSVAPNRPGYVIG